MRRNFKETETFDAGQTVEWRNGSHWLPGEVTGPQDRDSLGFAFYPVRNLKTTRTISCGEVISGYPGSIR